MEADEARAGASDGLLSSLVQTRSMELVLAPIASQVRAPMN